MICKLLGYEEFISVVVYYHLKFKRNNFIRLKKKTTLTEAVYYKMYSYNLKKKCFCFNAVINFYRFFFFIKHSCIHITCCDKCLQKNQTSFRSSIFLIFIIIISIFNSLKSEILFAHNSITKTVCTWKSRHRFYQQSCLHDKTN